MTDPLFWITNGARKSLENLTTAERHSHVAANKAMISVLAQTIPILSVATFAEAAVSGDVPSPMSITRAWMERQGIRNDGLVPTNSQVLPYAPYVILSGLEHARTITSGPIGKNMAKTERRS